MMGQQWPPVHDWRFSRLSGPPVDFEKGTNKWRSKSSCRARFQSLLVLSSAILCSDSRRTLYISGLHRVIFLARSWERGDYAAQTGRSVRISRRQSRLRASLSDFVSVTVFVIDIEQIDAIHRVRREYFPKEPPASTMVQVSRLVEKKCLIEINAIAVID